MNQRIRRIKELFGYAATLAKENGIGTMLRRGAGFFKRRFFGRRARYLPDRQTLAAQRAEDTQALPVISICVPFYNTPEKFLKDLVQSILNQTCPRWELCAADASDAEHPEVGQYLQKLAGQDKRIRYKKIENKGISANTNAAAALATGEYLALADHDDILAPHAVFAMGKSILRTEADFLYSDEALFKKRIDHPMVAHFKPNYAPDYLLCCNYICHLAVFRRSLFESIGGERPECDGSQDHDLFLRLIDASGKAPVHVPHVLYYWRVHAASTSGGVEAKPYVAEAAQKAIADHIARTGEKGTVKDGLFPSTYKVDWEIPGRPLVSIIIPNKDHADDLEKCLSSLYAKTSWKKFEVLVVENNSTQQATFDYYDSILEKYPSCTMLRYQGEFNFSRINNFGRAHAKGEYLLMLNNDVEIINPDWLTEMLMQASRPGAAICGAMLYYPDDTIQHAGVITGLGGYAGHSHKYKKRGGSGYMFRAATVQDLSCVTAACLLVRTSVFDQVGGMDEAFTVAFNDVDFCLRVRDAGYRVIWTPYAELYHYESKSRGSDEKDPAKKARFEAEHRRLYAVHGRKNILADPYYSPSLTLDREDFSESGDLRNLKQPKL